MSKPFRFAVQSYSATSAEDWRDQVRQAEDLGYAVFHTADHHIGPGPALDPTNHGVQVFGAIPAIMAAADATSTIRVGCRVFCTDYRNPVVFAKELASLDVLSGGRLDIGLGCGWLENEYDAMGIAFDRAGTRIARMEETIDLIRACFGEGMVDAPGPHVSASGFEGVPKPAAMPPIMIGGGSPKVLGIAGREADIVSLNFDNSSGKLGAAALGSGSDDQTAKKIEWIKAGAGDRFDDIELEIGGYFTVVTDHGEATAAAIAGRFGAPPEAFANHTHALIGSVDEIVDKLEERRDRFGITFTTIGVGSMHDFAPVLERLC